MDKKTLYEIVAAGTEDDIVSRINIAISKLMLDLRVNVVIANSDACKSGDYLFGSGCKIAAYNNIVNALFSYGDLSVGNLAYYAGINIKNIHRYLNTLEDDGYIKRRYSPSDKKVTIISPTKKLVKLYQKYSVESRNFTEKLYNSRLSAEEQNKMYGLICELSSYIDRLAPESKGSSYNSEENSSAKSDSSNFDPSEDFNYLYADDSDGTAKADSEPEKRK